VKPLARLCASAYTHLRMIGGAVGGGGGGGFDASTQGASIEEAATFVAHDRQVYFNDALDARELHARERGNNGPPSISPQRERADLINELRSHFASEGRSFKMVRNSSNARGAKFQCDGCSFEFRISKCTNSSSDLCGTWDLANKSMQSWKVCLPHALKSIDAFAQRVPTLVCLVA
jgi:hypothetical protein